jgi:NAD(P)-dependent dehydrogenase (short-subunit alcohol dehydrogenase family)
MKSVGALSRACHIYSSVEPNRSTKVQPPVANVEYIHCDLTDPASLSSAAQHIREKWGDPTVLCAIAGIVRGKPLLGEH